jgi:ketosteroid isomerase-like protein
MTKRLFIKAFAVPVALPLLIAAAPSSKAQTLAAAAPFIDKANKDWTHAIVSGDADVLSAPYAADGLFIGPQGATVRGHDAVRAMYAKRRKDVQVLTAKIHSEGRTVADKNDVYEWGSASMKVRSNGQTRNGGGRYLTVWHRDGKAWRIIRNLAF